MSTNNFHLLVNQHGERFIFYKSPNGEKVIEDFAKIPYTAESLFEDIKDEFSAFPWEDDDTDNEYNDNGVLISKSIDDFTISYFVSGSEVQNLSIWIYTSSGNTRYGNIQSAYAFYSVLKFQE